MAKTGMKMVAEENVLIFMTNRFRTRRNRVLNSI